MRLLVTGSRGFVGRSVIAAAERLGHSAVGLSVRPDDSARDGKLITMPGVEAGDIWKALNGLEVDCVLHLASYGVKPQDRDRTLLHDINIRLGVNLAMVASEFGARCIVAAGSSAEYAGPVDRPFREDDPVEKLAPYGLSKAVGGQQLLESAAKVGLRALVLRLFNVYGPGEAPHRLLPSLARRLLRNEKVPLSPGEQLRDFIFVEDVADSLVGACVRLDTEALAHPILNLATGCATSVRHFSEKVAAVLGKDATLLDFGAIPHRPHEQLLVVGDPSRYEAIFGPTLPTGLDIGIGKSVEKWHSG